MSSKKKIIIILGSILVVLLLLIGFYFFSLTSVDKKDDTIVSFTINEGMGKREVIDNLYNQKLVRSKLASMLYVFLKKDIVLQPGTYKISRNMNVEKIFNKLTTGGAYKITFVEGKKLTDYLKQISDLYGYDEEEMLKELSDQEYLKTLIEKYDFLDESILNSDLYYPLEGYIHPATYNLGEDDTIREIIVKTLDKTKEILDNYSTLIKESGYSYHEILTIASIIENETKYAEDKDIVSQVIYKRLKQNINLGMDVTTYYGVRKAFQEELTKADLDAVNPYNTRNVTFKGLPVGPICNPSIEAIDAALNPSDTEYVYFYADIDGKLHFAETEEEHEENKNIYGW